MRLGAAAGAEAGAVAVEVAGAVVVAVVRVWAEAACHDPLPPSVDHHRLVVLHRGPQRRDPLAELRGHRSPHGRAAPRDRQQDRRQV
jgi:hypothetical protein